MILSTNQHLRSLQFVKKFGITFCLLLFLCQVGMDQSTTNVLCNALAAGTFILAIFLTFNPVNLRGGAALTATAAFLSVSSNSIMPMLGTLIEGHSLIHSLSSPVGTFTHRSIFAIVLFGAHFFCLSPLMHGVKRQCGNILSPLGIRAILHPQVVWAVGGFGVLTILLRWSVAPPGSVIDRFLLPFSYLATAPFILLVPPYLNSLKSRPVWIAGLGGIFLVNAGLGITSRMAFIAPFAVVGSAFLMSLIASNAEAPKRLQIRYVIIAFVALFLLGQFQDLSTAIIVERAHRSERSWSENLSSTFRTFQDKKALAEYDEDAAAEIDRIESLFGEFWKEDYINQPFIARFTAIKFDDNILTMAPRYSSNDIAIIKEITSQKILAQLPNPMINAIGISVDKDWVTSFSMGDLMNSLANPTGRLGGLKTGSLVIHSFVIFGWMYPLVLFALLVTTFAIFQTLAIPLGRGPRGKGLSSFAMMFCFYYYMGFAVEGYHAIVFQLVRGIWQNIIIYSAIIWIATHIARTISTSSIRKST